MFGNRGGESSKCFLRNLKIDWVNRGGESSKCFKSSDLMVFCSVTFGTVIRVEILVVTVLSYYYLTGHRLNPDYFL